MDKNKRIAHLALDSHVLAVAVKGSIEDWSSYIGAVKGENHCKEYMEVAENGTKLPRQIAEFLFPDFAERFTWRS